MASRPTVPLVPRRRLGDILIQAGVLDEAQLHAALAEQTRWGGPLGKILVSLKFCSEDSIMQALSAQLNMSAVRLEGRVADDDALRCLTVEFCQQNAVFPFAFVPLGKFLDVAMADPTDLRVLDEIRVRTKTNPRPFLAGPQQIDAAIRRHYLGEPEAVVGAGFDSWGAAVAVNLGGTVSSDRNPAVGSGNYPTVAHRIDELVARCDRNEKVLRVLLRLFADKDIASREEIKKRLQER